MVSRCCLSLMVLAHDLRKKAISTAVSLGRTALFSLVCVSPMTLSGCMDWDNSEPIQCRNSPQEQQQWGRTLGLTAWVSLAANEGISINLHPYQNIDVEALHLTPLGQQDALPWHLRIKPDWEADWYLPMGNAPATPVSGRYLVELIGSTTKEGSPRHAARCWRLSKTVDFSSHVGMLELKATPT